MHLCYIDLQIFFLNFAYLRIFLKISVSFEEITFLNISRKNTFSKTYFNLPNNVPIQIFPKFFIILVNFEKTE